MRVIGLATVALALFGCFPDYQVGAGGSVRRDRKGGAYISPADDTRLRNDNFEDYVPEDYYADAGFRCAATPKGTTPADMALIAAENLGLSYTSNETPFSVKFSRDFLIDKLEVTVKRYRAWVNSGQPTPCENGTCTLDSGGPYEQQMVWNAEWNAVAKQANYNAKNGQLADCFTPVAYDGSGILPADKQELLATTWELGQTSTNENFPMTCVSWFQAAAFCASEGKRLPTEAEWVFAATNRGKNTTYPWGSDPPACERAIIEGCKFPTSVGSVTAGQTENGVKDMAGSVFEWVWDRPWTVPPQAETDWAGPPTP